MDEEHKDPETINLEAPCLARCMNKAWKKHKNIVYWVDYQTCSTETIEVLSNKIERQHPLQYTPSLIVSRRLFNMDRGEIICEKVYASPRRPPKISWRHNSMKELGSEVAGHGESSQLTQPKTPNPIVRIGRHVATEQTFLFECSRNPYTFLS